MNKVIFKGNLVKDPEIRANANGEEYAFFTIAVRRDRRNSKGEYEVDYPRCIAFGSNATTMKNYFKKGSGILVEGRIRTGSYEDNQGNKVYTTDFPIDHIEFIDKKESKDNTNPFEEMGKKVEEDMEYPF